MSYSNHVRFQNWAGGCRVGSRLVFQIGPAEEICFCFFNAAAGRCRGPSASVVIAPAASLISSLGTKRT